MFAFFMHLVYRKPRGKAQALAGTILAALVLAALDVSAASASELACAASPPRTSMTLSLPPPAIDNSLTQPQLQRLAPHRHPGRALGLYRAVVNGDFDLGIEIRWNETEACLWLSTIALRLEATDREIYVIRERRPGTCAYEAVLAHERRHEAVDAAVINAFGPRLEAALAQRAASLGIVRVAAGERDAAQRWLVSAIDEVFREQMRLLQEERERRQQAIDNAIEYRRIAAACDPLRNRG